MTILKIVFGPINNPTDTEIAIDKALPGLRGNWPKGLDSITIEGVTYTKDEFLAKLETFSARYRLVGTTKQAYDNALNDRDAHQNEANLFMQGFFGVLSANLGKTNATLPNFGCSIPKTRAPATIEKKSVSNAKRAATREARHTMGHKQKAGIHGAVTSEGATSEPTEAAPPNNAPPTKA